jgi:hypothetical protein
MRMQGERSNEEKQLLEEKIKVRGRKSSFSVELADVQDNFSKIHSRISASF